MSEMKEQEKLFQNKKKVPKHLHLLKMQFQGIVSSSYSFNDFGILYSQSNNIYFGYFKNDLFHGPGLLLSNSNIANTYLAYGFWNKNQLNGRAIISSEKGLVVTNILKGKENGLCFFLNFQSNLWSTYEFINGHLNSNQIKYISQIYPQQLQSNEELFKLYTSFSDHSYNQIFQNLDPYYPVSIFKYGQLYYLGYYQNNILQGLGFKLNHYSLFQAGYYRKNMLNGYAYRRISNTCLYYGNFQNNNLKGVGVIYDSENNKYTMGQFAENTCLKIVKQGVGYGKIELKQLVQQQKKHSPNIIKKKHHINKIALQINNIVQKFINLQKKVIYKQTQKIQQEIKIRNFNNFLKYKLDANIIQEEIFKIQNAFQKKKQIAQIPVLCNCIINQNELKSTIRKSLSSNKKNNFQI